MTYHFVYEPDFRRIITSVIIDARASIPDIKNQTGVVIKDYVDSKIALINSASIVYKIENTDNGVLVGVFCIQVNIKNKTATLIMQFLRPAYKVFINDISGQIVNFIQLGDWKKDFLF